MRFGHVVRASSPPKCLDRDVVGRRRTGTRHGNVYRSVGENQGNFVYRQSVLQTVTSLRVVSLVFRGHDLLKIANMKFGLKNAFFGTIFCLKIGVLLGKYFRKQTNS